MSSPRQHIQLADGEIALVTGETETTDHGPISETVWRPRLGWMRGSFHECAVRPEVHIHWSNLQMGSRLSFPLPEIPDWFVFNFTLTGAWKNREQMQGRSCEYGEVSGQMSLIHRARTAQYTCLASESFVHLTAAMSESALRAWLGPEGPHEDAGLQRLRRFLDGHGWPALTVPLTRSAQRTVESIMACPHHGFMRAVALESRFNDLVLELIQTLSGATEEVAPGVRSDDLERIHAAADLLRRQIDQPPSLTDLARAVGVSDSKLKRGFRQVFGTTAFGFLRSRRMELAREMIESGRSTVLEAAIYVGYSNPSNFASAFRQQFGVNPKQFQMTARRWK